MKISAIEKKYFTTSDYNKFTNNILSGKITKQLNKCDKSDISGFVNNTDLNEKIKALATKT